MDAEDFLEPDELADGPVGPEPTFEPACGGCDAPITWVDPAWICSRDCTWCTECAESHGMACPDCGEGLQRRPRRTQKAGR